MCVWNVLWFNQLLNHLFSFQGLAEKANDSLDMMFDTTAYGEYKSCNSSHLSQSQPCDDDDDDDEKEEDNGRELCLWYHAVWPVLVCLTSVVSFCVCGPVCFPLDRDHPENTPGHSKAQ